DILAMTHRRVENSALSMHARPGGWIWRPLIWQAGHARRFLRKQHVKIPGEVAQRIPLLHQRDMTAQLFDAGKPRIDDPHLRDLLDAVNDKLRADHSRVRIGLLAEVSIAPGARTAGVSFVCLVSVKRVGC